MALRQFLNIFKRDGAEENTYEFCPRCDANLTLQKGYRNDLPYWICKGCGEMLINPEVDADDDISWICDECGAMLNIQPGFGTDCGEWICTECGFKNRIDPSELYLSEDEYQAQKSDPYKGLSDEDALKIALWGSESPIDEREHVFLVTNRDTDQKAVKKLLRAYDRSVYDFLLSHPVSHIPKVLDLFEGDNCLIVIEEYVPGTTLAGLLENGPLDQAEAVRIAKCICEILNDLHNMPTPIIHRDIKPSNIIVTPNNEVVLLDMNAAKWYDADKTEDTRYMGTENYAAPEQAGYGMNASSEKTDVYALGMLLNVMLTGEFPKHKKADRPILSIIEKCIQLESGKRYTTKELMDVLDALKV